MRLKPATRAVAILMTTLAAAVALAGDDMIQVPAGTIVTAGLTYGALADGVVNIIGAGAASTIIDGGGTATVLVNAAPPASAVNITGLTIQNGTTALAATAGGVTNAGAMSLNDVQISGTEAAPRRLQPRS